MTSNINRSFPTPPEKEGSPEAREWKVLFCFFKWKQRRTSIKSQKCYCRGRFSLHRSQTWPAGSHSLCGQDHSDRLIRISWHWTVTERLTDQIQDAVSTNRESRVHSRQGSCQGTLPEFSVRRWFETSLLAFLDVHKIPRGAEIPQLWTGNHHYGMTGQPLENKLEAS